MIPFFLFSFLFWTFGLWALPAALFFFSSLFWISLGQQVPPSLYLGFTCVMGFIYCRFYLTAVVGQRVPAIASAAQCPAGSRRSLCGQWRRGLGGVFGLWAIYAAVYLWASYTAPFDTCGLHIQPILCDTRVETPLFLLFVAIFPVFMRVFGVCGVPGSPKKTKKEMKIGWWRVVLAVEKPVFMRVLRGL